MLEHKKSAQEILAGSLTGNEKVVDLVNKDTDGDGVPDWEESLWGTDPTKAETTPGTPDSVAIEKLKAQQEAANGTNSGTSDANLTQTDKFSREFLATVTTLNENGAMDQTTVDKLSASLADNIQNSPVRKIYTLADIKITKSDTLTTTQKYDLDLTSIFQKASVKYTVFDVLQKFTADSNNVDPSVLGELDPIIKETTGFINGMVSMQVPSSLASLHLDVLNGFERIVENLNDIKLYDTDVVVSLSGITKYQENANTLILADKKLTDALNKKLQN